LIEILQNNLSFFNNKIFLLGGGGILWPKVCFPFAQSLLYTEIYSVKLNAELLGGREVVSVINVHVRNKTALCSFKFVKSLALCEVLWMRTKVHSASSFSPQPSV
jgi:hypothetical protein